MKSSASESKPFQRRNSRLSQAERTAEPFQIQIGVFFMYLIQGIRPGLNVAFYMRRIELPN